MSGFITNVGNAVRRVTQRASTAAQAALTVINPKTKSPTSSNTGSIRTGSTRQAGESLANIKEPIATHALMSAEPFKAPTSAQAKPAPIIFSQTTVSISQPTSTT